MGKLKIIIGENDPILRAVSEPVKKFGSALEKFVKDMKDTMMTAKGLGIAAPQVGENLRVFIVILNYQTDHQIILTVVNPEIISKSDDMVMGEEGCLSLPGRYGQVARHKKITVQFLDVDGNRQMLSLRDLNARVVQHENDHIDGILFIDRMQASEKEEDLLM